MIAEVLPLRPRPTCVVCGGGMNCEFCPVPEAERAPRTTRGDCLIVGRQVVLDVRGDRMFLHPRARR